MTPTTLLSIRQLQSPHAGPFTLDIGRGECVAILGPSGSGKSVFLRLLADLDPGSGEVYLAGEPRESCSGPAWRSKVVYHAAEPAWWELTAAAHFSAEQGACVQGLLPLLNLSPALLDSDITRLSTGERQRLALIRSLACQPQVLLLDEPTSALDPASTLAVEQLLRSRLEAGLAIVLVTHSEALAGRLGQRCLHMDKGCLTP